jgi:hypothetical protein
VRGTLYITAGPEPTSTDVYRITGGVPGATRLTYTRPKLGILDVTAAGGTVIVDASPNADSVICTLASTGQCTPLENQPPRSGSPRLSPDGSKLAYVEVRPIYVNPGTPGHPETHLFHYIVHVRDLQSKTDREVFESANEVSHAEWGPGGLLVVLESPDANARMHLIQADGHDTTLTSLPSARNIVVSAATGRLAVVVGYGATVVLDPTGRPEASVSGSYFPAAWSPDGSQLLIRDAPGLATKKEGDKMFVIGAPSFQHPRPVGRSPAGPYYHVAWLR